MTEKEKMISGDWYAAYDDELVLGRKQAKALCKEFNQKPTEENIKKILGKHGEKVEVEPNFWCDYGYNIKVGENFYANHNCVILDSAEVSFGDNVLIGPNCGFYTPSHPLDAKTRNTGIESAKPIKIGNNVWFGGNVTVLGGVTIGDNTVIGAGSVVTHDIPANVVAFGSPCKATKDLDK